MTGMNRVKKNMNIYVVLILITYFRHRLFFPVEFLSWTRLSCTNYATDRVEFLIFKTVYFNRKIEITTFTLDFCVSARNIKNDRKKHHNFIESKAERPD